MLHFVGPARVFLSPGKRHCFIDVKTKDGVVRLELDAEFEAGKRYELVVLESGDDVAFELFELHPSSYAAIYPDG